MKIEDAEKHGLIFKNGKWGKITSQGYFQIYHIKKCCKCNSDFLVSHSTIEYCSSSCHLKGNQHTKGVKFNRPHKEKYLHKQTGYILIYKPMNAMANRKGMILEHRFVMSEHLKRHLFKNEHVHHINGDRTDNRLENLILLTKSVHNSLHKKEEVKNFKRNKHGQFI